MTPIPNEIIESAISIIGRPGIDDEHLKRSIRSLVHDDMTALRLRLWIPEAFGLVLITHISDEIILPKTFSAMSAAGEWVEFPFQVEPILAPALKLAQRIFHEGPKEIFLVISKQGAMLDAVNNALHSGITLDGAHLSGPAFIGIPAEVYSGPPKSFWRRLFGG